jgi:hypothetical protein
MSASKRRGYIPVSAALRQYPFQSLRSRLIQAIENSLEQILRNSKRGGVLATVQTLGNSGRRWLQRVRDATRSRDLMFEVHLDRHVSMRVFRVSSVPTTET